MNKQLDELDKSKKEPTIKEKIAMARQCLSILKKMRASVAQIPNKKPNADN